MMILLLAMARGGRLRHRLSIKCSVPERSFERQSDIRTIELIENKWSLDAGRNEACDG